VTTLPDSNRSRRIGFVTGLTKQLLAQRYDPGYAIFAKGDDADKLIVVSLEQGRLDTVYRVRALLATLTAVSRMTPFFQQNTVAEQATFLDLLKLTRSRSGKEGPASPGPRRSRAGAAKGPAAAPSATAGPQKSTSAQAGR
jgi:hypothetical protein